MIAYLTGEVIQVAETSSRVVLLTSSGVGYSVVLPAFVRESLQPHEGQSIDLHIYYSVTERQPLPLLVGFESASDRDFFEQFIQVEGIGPARAATALTMPVPTVAYAIENEDTATLKSMPGVGERGAQKIIATLRGKVAEVAERVLEPQEQNGMKQQDTRADVVSVLVDLGYRNAEAIALVDEVIRRDPESIDDPQKLLQDVFRYNTRA